MINSSALGGTDAEWRPEDAHAMYGRRDRKSRAAGHPTRPAVVGGDEPRFVQLVDLLERAEALQADLDQALSGQADGPPVISMTTTP